MAVVQHWRHCVASMGVNSALCTCKPLLSDRAVLLELLWAAALGHRQLAPHDMLILMWPQILEKQQFFQRQGVAVNGVAPTWQRCVPVILQLTLAWRCSHLYVGATCGRRVVVVGLRSKGQSDKIVAGVWAGCATVFTLMGVKMIVDMTCTFRRHRACLGCA